MKRTKFSRKWLIAVDHVFRRCRRIGHVVGRAAARIVVHDRHALLRAFRRHARAAWRTGRHYVRHVIRRTPYMVRRIHRAAVRLAKRVHYQVAHRPHQHLRATWRWYDVWHGRQFHGHVHGAIFVAELLLVGIFFTGMYRTALALGDVADTWTFTSPSAYVHDDGIEVIDNKARLRAQNYISDPHTAALYHLDESTGTLADDASSHQNDAAITNGTFGAGNLNNGLALPGVNAGMSVPDSTSISLSQQNSLEAWTKLSNTFAAGSTTQRQSIIDKGDYQLYYDNETGKVVYELASNASDDWSRVAGNDANGSWDVNGKRSVNAFTRLGGDVYAGIGADIGDAEVWKLSGSTWTTIGGGAVTPVNNSWDVQTYESVYALANDGTNVYAGLGTSTGDAEVWSFNGTSWTKIGGDGVNGGWGISTYETIYALQMHGGSLYAALGSSANDAEVFRWNGSAWTKIGGDGINSGWTTNYEMVASMASDGAYLYAGLGSTAGDGEVWRFNAVNASWTKIGGDGVNGGWDATIETVRSLRVVGSTLYAGLGDSAGDADVWSWNGSTWAQIGGDGMNGSWTSSYEQIGAFANDGNDLYVGLGTSDGDGEVYRWNGTTWTKIGGDGVNGSWVSAWADTVNALAVYDGVLYAGTYDAGGTGWVYSYEAGSWTIRGGNYVGKSWGFYGFGSVPVMQSVGGFLYAGMGTGAGTAVVLRYDGTSWTVVGGQGINGSWAPNSYESIMSMASYAGKLFVGLGTSANDAEVWSYDGVVWAQVGGDSLGNGWTTNYEEVDAMAAYGNYLYVGLGTSANDAEVWRYDGATWTKIGGDSLNSGWTTNYDRVVSMAFFRGQLVAGLGSTAGEAEVWRWNGAAWSKIGGDAVAGSWEISYEQVDSLIAFNNKLYAGLGTSADDAEVWEYNGTSWTKIGGDGINDGWIAGTYERVRTMGAYNGDLYIGLGNTAGDAEVWRWNGTTWTKIGGNGLNNGWGNGFEEVQAFGVYKGKLFVSLGLTANADAQIYTLGSNAYLESATNSFDTNWRHIAATYDGAAMRLYINGTLNASTDVAVSLPDSNRPLLIGQSYAARENKSTGVFDGMLDEVRISSIARDTFTAKPYAASAQTIQLEHAVRKSGIWTWDDFITSESTRGGTVTYRLSDDDGATWKYWSGSAWVLSASTTQASDMATIDAHISTFPVTFDGIGWQAVLKGNGSQQVALQSVAIESTADTDPPTVASTVISATKVLGGQSLTDNAWTNGGAPAFSWTPAVDGEAGIKGYCLYLGADPTADPLSTKGLLGNSPANAGSQCHYLVSSATLDLATPGALAMPLTTSVNPYYLKLKAIDRAGNISNNSVQFRFRFDNTTPVNPGFITAPSGFVNSKEVTLMWPTSGTGSPTDGASGLAGLQYRIGANGAWYGDAHTGHGDMDDLLIHDGSYTTVPTPDFDDIEEGINTVYFRTWDRAGNVSASYVTAALKINTAGAPSEPQNVQASPASSGTNAFAFQWDEPASFVGNANSLTYCYTFNVVPNSTNCTFTSPGVKSLGSGPYATQPGINTIYVVAKDESNNITYDSYATASFTANTPAPGMALNLDIVDVSIKATNNWRLALTWDSPTFSGTGIASYRIFRSTDNTTFTMVGASSSTTYIDANLGQQAYSYKIRACDSTNNCGALSSSVADTPTGKFTAPAVLVAEPTVSDRTTKKATIRWSTDRPSDSKVAIGTSSGRYAASEIASSAQVSAHQIDLDNLAAGTTYYVQAKWTDEDGNTGISQEFSFTTAPPPTLKEISTVKIGLTAATIQFTSKNATRVAVYYGKSEGFGGLKTINTSAVESTYAIELTGLDDGAKYFYQLVSFDSEGNAYDGNVFSFTTVPRPRISNLTFQPIAGEPTSTQKVTWQTNVPSTSTVTYGKVGSGGQDTQDSTLVTSHEIVVRDLEDDSQYFLFAQSRDSDGNLAISDRQIFQTALDTRPPTIGDISTEASIRGSGAEARGQVVVSWRTDEPSTSQVAYAEGSDVKVFNNKTAEDGALSFEHIVIVSDLPTSKVYSIQPISRDKSGNAGTGEPQSAIIGRASDNVLTIVMTTLKNIFGF